MMAEENVLAPTRSDAQLIPVKARLPIGKCEEVLNMVVLEKRTVELNECQVGSDPEEEPGKANMETKVESMVSVPIHQASSSVPPLSTPVIDISPPKLSLPPIQEPTVTATTSTITTKLPLPPPPPQ
nr:hypothetical protein [Tanacetum cinerariifolium]